MTIVTNEAMMTPEHTSEGMWLRLRLLVLVAAVGGVGVRARVLGDAGAGESMGPILQYAFDSSTLLQGSAMTVQVAPGAVVLTETAHGQEGEGEGEGDGDGGEDGDDGAAGGGGQNQERIVAVACGSGHWGKDYRFHLSGLEKDDDREGDDEDDKATPLEEHWAFLWLSELKADGTVRKQRAVRVDGHLSTGDSIHVQQCAGIRGGSNGLYIFGRTFTEDDILVPASAPITTFSSTTSTASSASSSGAFVTRLDVEDNGISVPGSTQWLTNASMHAIHSLTLTPDGETVFVVGTREKEDATSKERKLGENLVAVLAALNGSSGQLLWSHEWLFSVASSVCTTLGSENGARRVLVGFTNVMGVNTRTHRIAAFDAQTGTRVWDRNVGDTPVAGGLICLPNHQAALIAAWSNRVELVDVDNGNGRRVTFSLSHGGAQLQPCMLRHASTSLAEERANANNASTRDATLYVLCGKATISLRKLTVHRGLADEAAPQRRLVSVSSSSGGSSSSSSDTASTVTSEWMYDLSSSCSMTPTAVQEVVNRETDAVVVLTTTFAGFQSATERLVATTVLLDAAKLAEESADALYVQRIEEDKSCLSATQPNALDVSHVLLTIALPCALFFFAVGVVLYIVRRRHPASVAEESAAEQVLVGDDGDGGDDDGNDDGDLGYEQTRYRSSIAMRPMLDGTQDV